MKTKSIFFSLMLLLVAGMASTSCEDMFTTENSLVETDMTPQDTVFQIMGIVRNMQKVVDKSIILGEVRADLVDVTDENNPYTPDAIKQISQNKIDENNAYNSPADFYAVINSCNIYLAHVDSLQEAKGVKKYREEVIAAKTYRAWAYLELAKIYGRVPFFTEPVTTSADGEDIVANESLKKDLVEICNVLIDDKQEGIGVYKGLDENNSLQPGYNRAYQGIQYRNFFIPLRVMLAELYLYRGSFTQNKSDFVEAVKLYHDFLAFKNEERPLNCQRSTWRGPGINGRQTSYDSNFGPFNTTRDITAIPMDTIAYNGITTDIRAVFNAQYANNYYPYVSPSNGLLELSQSQLYFQYVFNSITDYYTQVLSQSTSDYTDSENNHPEYLVGDLRFKSVLSMGRINDPYHLEYNKVPTWNIKYTGGSNRVSNDIRPTYVRLYRLSTIYLHFAEALTRAGFPETAFAVLKYGLSEEVLNDRTKISQEEYDGLAALTSYGFASNAADWDRLKFTTVNRDNYDARGQGEPNQWGVHCLGSGDVWADFWCTEAQFAMPMPADMSEWQTYPEYTPDETWTDEEKEAYDAEYAEACDAVDKANAEFLRRPEVIAERAKAVDKLILDEEALENCYEGTRFYDLMRYSKYNFGDFSYVVEAVSKRRGASDTNDTGNLSASNVYLPLKSR